MLSTEPSAASTMPPAIKQPYSFDRDPMRKVARHGGITQLRMNDMLGGRLSRFSLDAFVNNMTAIGQRAHVGLEAA